MRIKGRVAIGLSTAILVASMPLLAVPASAATTPPWEPDPNAATTGTLIFYNSSGTPVTGGSDLNHLFDYAQASTVDTTDGTKAAIEFANPKPNTATGNFFVGADGTFTSFPNASAPAPLTASPNPVVTVAPTGANLANFIQTATANDTAGYTNVFQVRLVTSAPGGGGTLGNGGAYWDADVLVNPTAGTWVEEYPTQGAGAVATTTTLTAAPASVAKQHSSVTLTATEVANDTTHPAGSVEFFQDGQSLGSSSANATTGVATLTTKTLLPSAPSKTSLTATFTPSNASSYAPSTSSALHYTVNPVAATPSISGPHRVGGTEKCSANGLTFGVTASYNWLVSGKKVATGKSYKVAASAYKKKLSCTATVRAGSGPSSSATSKSVTVSLGSALRASKKPTLSGPHAVGKTETVNHGTWSPSASSYSYQWLLNGSKIKGATKSSYKLVGKDKGKKISCTVTAKKKAYASGTAMTKAVKVS